MGEHGKHRPLVGAAALLAALALFGGKAEACRLALALAMDVSSSVDAREDSLQRRGLAEALRDEDVTAAFFAAPNPVALAVYEWSGRYNQVVLQDWRLIETRADLLDVAGTISASQRSHNDFPTAMGYALGFGATLLQAAPRCTQSKLDMSGDGANNEGFGPEDAYREFTFDGVTVNGLVVNAGEYEAEVDLIEYYATEVIRGPGAFVEIATGFEDFEVAMERKLIRELGPLMLGAAE